MKSADRDGLAAAAAETLVRRYRCIHHSRCCTLTASAPGLRFTLTAPPLDGANLLNEPSCPGSIIAALQFQCCPSKPPLLLFQIFCIPRVPSPCFHDHHLAHAVSLRLRSQPAAYRRLLVPLPGLPCHVIATSRLCHSRAVSGWQKAPNSAFLPGLHHFAMCLPHILCQIVEVPEGCLLQ